MARELIRKRPEDYAGANLPDYDACAKTFCWTQARGLLEGLPGGGLNIAHEAIDRHVKAGQGGKLALRWIGRDDSIQDFSYAALGAAMNRFANVLARRGVGKGDRVYSLLGRVPELYIAALGTLKNGSVFSPLFSAFGPEPIKSRMAIGEANALLTTEAYYRRKIEPWRKELASLKHVFLVDCSANPPPETIDLAAALAQAPETFEVVATKPEDMALLHFTSGTTGKPKGAVHVHEAVVAHHITGRMALDLHADDIFWCTADPGWVTGTSYGIISPLTNGATMIVDQAEFDAERWYHALQFVEVFEQLMAAERYPRQQVVVTTEIFRRGMDDEVNAEFERADVVRRGERGINHSQYPVSFRHFHHRRQIEHAQIRIGRRFGEDDVGVGPDGGFDGLGGGRHEGVLHAELGQEIGREIAGLPIAIAGENDVAVPFHVGHQRQDDRAHAGGKQDGAFGAFDGGQFTLGFGLRRIAVPAVFLFANNAALTLGRHELDDLGHVSETEIGSLDNRRGDGVMGLGPAFQTVNG